MVSSCYDAPVQHGYNPVGAGGYFGGVGDNDYGDALLPVKAGENVDYLFAGAAVEVAGGFVGEEDGGFFDEGAGDANALLLAAGEFCGAVAHPVTEADAFQGLAGALAPMSAARPVEQG